MKKILFVAVVVGLLLTILPAASVSAAPPSTSRYPASPGVVEYLAPPAQGPLSALYAVVVAGCKMFTSPDATSPSAPLPVGWYVEILPATERGWIKVEVHNAQMVSVGIAWLRSAAWAFLQKVPMPMIPIVPYNPYNPYLNPHYRRADRRWA